MRNRTVRPISQRIAHFRKLAGLSQEDMAGKLGMTPESYQNKEDNADIDCLFIMNISVILGIAVENLLYDKSCETEQNLYYPIAPSGVFTRNEECFVAALRMLDPKAKEKIISLTRKAAKYPNLSIEELATQNLPLE